MTAYVIEADGGSRGNPGPAGFGAVVRDAASGEVVAEVAGGIGRATNNVAEYRGLLAGLACAAELGASSVEARMDSKLVVEQLSGRWQVKHPDLKPLASEASRLARAIGDVRFRWVPREQNKHADRLANEAMDDAAAGREWEPRTPVTAAAQPAAPTNRFSGWMAADEPPTTTLLLRHGETPMSIDKRFSGVGDARLTERGLAQAAAAARRLAGRGGIDVIVSSPLARALATAQEVGRACGLDVVVEAGLRETDFGAWEGRTFAEVQRQWPDQLAAWLADADVAPPGGESFTATARRVRQARDRVISRYAGCSVLAVSHVTPIKTLTRIAVEAPPAALYRLHLDLASVTEIDWYADGPAVLRLFNDTSHLSAVERGVWGA
ncbi:MAG: bifunctional RNase H/acid phosphatase [Frankiaceae bacterium]